MGEPLEAASPYRVGMELRYFRDRRYVRINGRPLLLVYRVGLFPDFARTAATWRDLCRREGIGEIYLAMVESFDQAGAPARFGCDASVQFPPHGHAVASEAPDRCLAPGFRGTVYDYEASLLNYLRQPAPPAPRFGAVMPSWDNTARRMNQATIFRAQAPRGFYAQLERGASFPWLQPIDLGKDNPLKMWRVLVFGGGGQVVSCIALVALATSFTRCS